MLSYFLVDGKICNLEDPEKERRRRNRSRSRSRSLTPEVESYNETYTDPVDEAEREQIEEEKAKIERKLSKNLILTLFL